MGHKGHAYIKFHTPYIYTTYIWLYAKSYFPFNSKKESLDIVSVITV
jgi:hypothetical protein